ncbi:hypothetical protein [Streptomyces sp. NPDC002221]|uniref:hypothetical protein n=1 Tax=Streptomyces sp. NPDC002221 TaxID=3364639 RepID=UPI0036CC5766
MINSSMPVGDWTWEVAPASGEVRPAARAAEVALGIWNILAERDLATPVGKVGVSVRSAGDVRDVLIDADGMNLEPEPLAPGTAFARAMDQAESVEEDCVVTIRVECPGYWLEPDGKYRAEKLFTIRVTLWARRSLMVTLETYSDAWLTIDTRNREQPQVHALNAPRLAAALEEISALCGSAPDPGDENYFAKPTPDGFEDVRIEGPAYDDSWGTFEVPDQDRRLRSALPDSEDEYECITDHPVRYLAVEHAGHLVGYLWASVADDAAGFAPRVAVGDIAFQAGAEWLLALREAHGQGLTPLAALDWLARRPPRPETGLIPGAVRELTSLDALEELSGRY